jgi:hypothetical protein
MIQLGQEVKDTVTGFTGIATAKVEYLNGCVQFCVKPKIAKNKEMPGGCYIDIEQLEVVGNGVYVAPKNTGGDMGNDTPSGAYRG